jgi:hypothetical protein
MATARPPARPPSPWLLLYQILSSSVGSSPPQLVSCPPAPSPFLHAPPERETIGWRGGDQRRGGGGGDCSRAQRPAAALGIFLAGPLRGGRRFLGEEMNEREEDTGVGGCLSLHRSTPLSMSIRSHARRERAGRTGFTGPMDKTRVCGRASRPGRNRRPRSRHISSI